MSGLEMQAAITRRLAVSKVFTADAALRGAAALWLCVVLLGQWAFSYYIASFYGPSTFSGNLENWNRLEALGATPFVAGDVTGNSVFVAHAFGAGIVAIAGALQLVPWVRTHA